MSIDMIQSTHQFKHSYIAQYSLSQLHCAYLNSDSLVVNADIDSVFLAQNLTSDLITLYKSNWLARLLYNNLTILVQGSLLIINLDLHLLLAE